MNRHLNPGTLKFVLQLHNSSLIELQCDDIDTLDQTKPVSGYLQTFRAHNLADHIHGLSWAIAGIASMLANNQQSISNLVLGDEKNLIQEYFTGRNVSAIEDAISEPLLSSLNRTLDERAAVNRPVLNLKALRLINLNPMKLLVNSEVQLIHFPSLTSLILESCKHLNELLLMLVRPTSAKSLDHSLTNLHNLTVRYEDVGPRRLSLQWFLCRLKPLIRLYVMLEGNIDPQNLRSILKTHGQSLRCLVWDRRAERRVSLTSSGAMGCGLEENLGIISNLCPNLVELGINIDWNVGKDIQRQVRSGWMNCLEYKSNDLLSLD